MSAQVLVVTAWQKTMPGFSMGNWVTKQEIGN